VPARAEGGKRFRAHRSGGEEDRAAPLAGAGATGSPSGTSLNETGRVFRERVPFSRASVCVCVYGVVVAPWVNANATSFGQGSAADSARQAARHAACDSQTKHRRQPACGSATAKHRSQAGCSSTAKHRSQAGCSSTAKHRSQAGCSSTATHRLTEPPVSHLDREPASPHALHQDAQGISAL